MIPIKNPMKAIRLTTASILAIAFNLPGLSQAANAQSENEMRPGVRYTTGSYRIEGWQNNLTKSDHNLARWNWSPIVGYTQSVASRPTGKGATAAPTIIPQRESFYIKPRHIPNPLVAQALPLKIPTTHSNTNTGARLLRRETTDVSANLMHKVPVAYTYARTTGTVGGVFDREEVYGVIKRK